jgi:haloalkane dehalogenase
MMQCARTPDEQFVGLPGYDFAPHYAEIADGDGGSLRVHYLDEGPADAAPVLLLHGEPSWCYLYRKMIPPLVAAGLRVVAPDLVGFGRSDKPLAMTDHTYARHVGWMHELVFDRLGLEDITFFGQDWGGLIGLRLVAAEPDRYARVVVSNTGLPSGGGALSDAFLEWQRFSQESPTFPIGKLVAGGCAIPLSPAEIAAYDAPFPEDRLTAGPRIMPSLVPTGPDDPAASDNLAAWDVLRRFERPFLCAFSDGDPMTAGTDRLFLERVPGATGQPHTTITGAGHFVQEDKGPELARIIIDFVATTSR